MNKAIIFGYITKDPELKTLLPLSKSCRNGLNTGNFRAIIPCFWVNDWLIFFSKSSNSFSCFVPTCGLAPNLAFSAIISVL